MKTATDHERVIRAARDTSNAALAAHDVERVAAFWAPDVQVTTSTGTGCTGAIANRERLAATLRRLPDVRWQRTAHKVEVFAAADIAAEHGAWEGRWSDVDGLVRTGGSYFAQWRRLDGRWLIQAEVFVPTWKKTVLV